MEISWLTELAYLFFIDKLGTKPSLSVSLYPS